MGLLSVLHIYIYRTPLLQLFLLVLCVPMLPAPSVPQLALDHATPEKVAGNVLHPTGMVHMAYKKVRLFLDWMLGVFFCVVPVLGYYEVLVLVWGFLPFLDQKHTNRDGGGSSDQK